MKTFHSNGKLLLTGEYLVLDGAKALAVPTKYGQSMTIRQTKEHHLHWKSLDHQGNIWFEGDFKFNEKTPLFFSPLEERSSRAVTQALLNLLYEAKKLNPDFLSGPSGYEVTTQLDFPNDWGLGSSSTLINNLAQWAAIDAYELLWNAFSGSGYDIACAQHNTPISYQLENDRPIVETVNFDPSFKGMLFFVHLNQKQNSRDAIAHYRSLEKEQLSEAIERIDGITKSILDCSLIEEFEKLLALHEKVMSNLLQLRPVRERLFSDFEGSIKSLGAWGGDFVMAVGDDTTQDYFRRKGYTTIIPYTKMVKA